MFGSVFLFIGLAACAFAVVRRRDGARFFFWLGIWSILRAARLLTGSPAVVAVMPPWLQACVPAVWTASVYLVLPVAVLTWLELSLGRVRQFLKAVILIAWLIGIAAIALFVMSGSPGRLMRYSDDLLAIVALIVLIVVVSVRRLAGRFLVLPNRAVVVVGTLVFGLEELYSNLARIFHYPFYEFYEVAGSAAFAVLLFSFGYIGIQIALASEHRLLSIENELAIARDIQASILPGSRPELKNLRVAAAYQPMTDVAGDFYEFISVDPNGTGFLVADVTGHGVPAALIAAMIKVAIQSVIPHAHDPSKVLCGLNRILCTQLHSQLVSAAYLWVDTERRIAKYSAAGHPPLLLWRDGKLERVECNGLLLGVFPDSDYPFFEIPIQLGDRFVLYTDGVIETQNASGDSFGDHRFEQVVCDNNSRQPTELLDQLLAEIRQWQPATATQHDDITLIVVDVV
jgi:phosphoserine phosphatase RsbU/P